MMKVDLLDVYKTTQHLSLPKIIETGAVVLKRREIECSVFA